MSDGGRSTLRQAVSDAIGGRSTGGARVENVVENAARPGALSAALPIGFAATLALSAFLLFAVQPLWGRLVLPVLGGTPAVWITCLFFFQATLFLGYLYAFWLDRRFPRGGQYLAHLAVTAAAVLFLPIGLPRLEALSPGQWPVLWLLLGGVVSVGPPAFALSATAPLLQRWFSRTGHPRAADPYFLYAASNAGSLLALVSYPFLIEPAIGLTAQSRTWSALFFAFGISVAACVHLARRATGAWPGTDRAREARPRGAVEAAARRAAGHEQPATRPGRGLTSVVEWVWLAFVPSALLASVTFVITSFLLPVPLLWIAPLALYLLGFILAFLPGLDRWPVRRLAVACAIVPAVAVPFAYRAGQGFVIHFAALISAFYVLAFLLHLRLARRRPAVERLTRYYLAIAGGGVLGSAVHVFLVPRLFTSRLDLWILLAAAAVTLVPARVSFPARMARAGFRRARLPLRLGAGVVAAGLVVVFGPEAPGPDVLLRERNFFGQYEVVERRGFRELRHGGISHGAMSLDPRYATLPVGYFAAGGPVADVFAGLRSSRSGAEHGAPAALRVAVVGVGVGGAAAFADDRDDWVFFEIDPFVVWIARDAGYFAYLSEMTPDARIVVGDGRLALEREAGGYDLILGDAFSGGHPPTHLLTAEALRLYLDRLAPGGVVALNLTSRYVELDAAVAATAAHLGVSAYVRQDPGLGRAAHQATTWVVLARNDAVLAPVVAREGWTRLAPDGRAPWTDQRADLVGSLRWRVPR